MYYGPEAGYWGEAEFRINIDFTGLGESTFRVKRLTGWLLIFF